ncbi:MAG: hypothetical protein Q8P07_03310 [bacterium]|nr:hypothetical protein [bacterium]
MTEKIYTQRESDNKAENREIPPLSVDIYYSPHLTEKDAGTLEEKLKDADIYAPELIHWKSAEPVYRAVSQGSKTPAEAAKELHLDDSETKRYTLKRLEIIYDSHKPIVFVDLPDDSELIKEYKEISFKPGLENFEEDLESIRSYMENSANFEKKREAYMISRLEPKVREAIEKYPELQNKDRLKILLSLGAMHTNLSHKLKEKGFDMNREFSSGQIVYPFVSEGIRRHMFGKEVGEEFVSKALLESLVWTFFRDDFKKKTDDTFELMKMFRETVSLFSTDEIKNLYAQAKDKNDFKKVLRGETNKKLKAELDKAAGNKG